MKQEYVVGFLWVGDCVVLIKKNKPAWQAGKWNGVGGKIEPGETPLQAMMREFQEETGYWHPNWVPFCRNVGPDYVVHFFSWITYLNVKTESKTDEEVAVVWPEYAFRNSTFQVIPNLVWLLPMSRFAWEHSHKPGNKFEAVVQEEWNNIPPESDAL